MAGIKVSLDTLHIDFKASTSVNILEGFSNSIDVGLPPKFYYGSTGSVYVEEQSNQNIGIPSAAVVNILAPRNVRAEIFSNRKIYTSRRIHRHSWQARLGAKLDPIKRKLIDNEILLTSHPTDMLRIRTKKDPRTRDLISRTITSVEVLPIVLPVLEDIPMKRMERKDGKLVLSFSMMNEDRRIEAYSPLEARLESDDLLFRIIKDEFSDEPYYMVMQVKEELGTIAYSSLLYMKYNLSFYDEELPEPVIEQLAAFAERREILEW